jgi:hypothetical protein
MAALFQEAAQDPADAPEDAQLLHGNWGIGDSQEIRPVGISYKVRVCYRGKARYLGKCVQGLHFESGTQLALILISV